MIDVAYTAHVIDSKQGNRLQNKALSANDRLIGRCADKPDKLNVTTNTWLIPLAN